jgi:hypothetical protein
MQPASNFATEIVPTLFKLFPAPFHKQHPVLLVGPGVAHAGPYAHESDAPFAAAGLHDAYVFHMGDWDSLGMYVNWLVYAADSTVTGSSPDFTSGPIIPNARFKTNWSGGIYHRDGGILIQRNPFAVCNLTDAACLDPMAAGNQTWPTVDGASHYPSFGLQTKRTTAPLWPQVGDWEWRWTGVDASGAGWTLTVPFTVLP